MDKKPYRKLLSVIDQNFYEQNYRDLNDPNDELESFFENTKFSEAYLDLDDFFSFHTDGLNYSSGKSLTEQYGDIKEEQRLKVIEVLFNIIYFSDTGDKFKKRIAGYLNRYNVVFSDDQKYKKVIFDSKGKCLEGSFGKVFFVDENFVKKQLKNEYWNDNDIASRFKNEFVIQKRLYDSNVSVLKVFDYNSITSSFLMERADFDLYDLLRENTISFEDQISLTRGILITMKSAHQMKIKHRDLHPGNIMIKNNASFVSDFGLAKDSNHLRSKLSTVTPKPTHKFVAPEGFTNFKDIDEISDIYSIAKIIDFIFGNGNLGTEHPFKLLVEKGTKDVRKDRFKNVDEVITSFENIYNTHLNRVDNTRINKHIRDGMYDLSVEEYLVKLAENQKISYQIVANRWVRLADVMLQCETQNQVKFLENIDLTFVKATGYKGWPNYDLFANIAHTMLVSSDTIQVMKLAYHILEECAKIRFSAKDLLDRIPYKKVQLITMHGTD